MLRISPCILDLLFSIDLQLLVNLAQASPCDLSGHNSRDFVMMGGTLDSIDGHRMPQDTGVLAVSKASVIAGLIPILVFRLQMF